MTHAIATLYGFCCTFFNITFLSAENSHEDLQSQVCGVFQCILNIVEGMYFCVFVFFFCVCGGEVCKERAQNKYGKSSIKSLGVYLISGLFNVGACFKY